MARLTIVHNPFDPIGSREIKEVPSGKPIYAVIDGFYCHFDVVVSLNGHITRDYEYVMKPEDHVGFMAVPGKDGEKNPVAIIAAVVLAVVTAGVSSYASGAMAAAGYSSAAASFGGALAGMAVSMVGGMLINSLLPPSMPSEIDQDGVKASATYGWGSVRNQAAEGIAVPIVYGKAKIVPPIISQYVETKGNKQYLNVLYALNDGEISSVSEIMINGNPIGFYSGVTSYTRIGTNNQTLIPSFDNTRVDTVVNAKLSTTATIRRTTYNNISGVTVIVSAPAGLYIADKTGGIEPQTVDLEVKLKKVGATSWIVLDSTSITGSTTSPIRQTFSVSGTFIAGGFQYEFEPGEYDISVRRISAESTSTRVQDKIYLESFTEIVHDDFTYPNTALLAIRALATDQLSGSMPTLSCVVDRGSGNSNPARAAQNILGIVGAQASAAAFDAWAAWCNAQGLKCNIVFDSHVNVREALNMVGLLGRANVVQVGSEFIPILDRAENIPVQRFMFTMGNIIKDSFQEDYLPLADRSNAIEVVYFDATLDYERQSVEIYQRGFDESTETIRKASVTLYGCTSRTQAIRHARFMMNKNRYLTNTVSFEADVDAIACTIGDVIDVSHDVPQWGYSGRFLDVGVVDPTHWAYANLTTVNGVTADGTNTVLVQIDRSIVMVPQTEYGLAIRLHDDTRISVSITTDTAIETDVIPLPVSVDVERFDLYAFGETSRVSKLFRVTSITRSSDQRRKITAIEYIPEVYNDTTDTIEVPTFSSLSPVSYLTMTTDTEIASDGRSINVISLMWNGQGISWDVYMKEHSSDGEWTLVGTTHQASYRIRDVMPGYYSFRVGDKEASATVIIARVPLADVQNFVSFYQNNQLVLRWDAVVEDYRTPIWYEVRRGASWLNSEILGKVTTSSMIVDTAGTYWVKAYYKGLDGIEVWSENATGISISSASILRNVVATWDEYATSWSGTLSNLITDADKIVLPAGTAYGYYDIPLSHIVTLSSPQLCRLSMRYSVAGGDVGLMWDDIVDVDLYPNIDGDVSGSWTAKPKIAISQDGTIWGAWQDFVIGEYVGMAFKTRLELYSNNPDITVISDGFSFTVDMPDRVERGTGVSIPDAGAAISYPFAFQTKPNVQITIVNAKQGDREVLSAEDEAGFTVQVINGGVGVARTINYFSQGY